MIGPPVMTSNPPHHIHVSGQSSAAERTGAGVGADGLGYDIVDVFEDIGTALEGITTRR